MTAKPGSKCNLTKCFRLRKTSRKNQRHLSWSVYDRINGLFSSNIASICLIQSCFCICIRHNYINTKKLQVPSGLRFQKGPNIFEGRMPLGCSACRTSDRRLKKNSRVRIVHMTKTCCEKAPVQISLLCIWCLVWETFRCCLHILGRHALLCKSLARFNPCRQPHPKIEPLSSPKQ